MTESVDKRNKVQSHSVEESEKNIQDVSLHPDLHQKLMGSILGKKPVLHLSLVGTHSAVHLYRNVLKGAQLSPSITVWLRHSNMWF